MNETMKKIEVFLRNKFDLGAVRKLVEDACEAARSDGYDEGFSDGEDSGYEDGFEKGQASIPTEE